jgi:hypothetical protein
MILWYEPGTFQCIAVQIHAPVYTNVLCFPLCVMFPYMISNASYSPHRTLWKI